jgi:hypothetical protein
MKTYRLNFINNNFLFSKDTLLVHLSDEVDKEEMREEAEVEEEVEVEEEEEVVFEEAIAKELEEGLLEIE